MAGGDAAVLEARNVTVRFGGVRAVDDVSLSLQPGRVYGLIGPNGAGKTTLFDVLSGLRAPTSGRLLLDGQDITRRSPTWRARHGVRRTFQRQQLFGWLSVEDNLLVALEWRGGGGGMTGDLLRLPVRRRLERQRRRQVDEVLALLDLDDVRHTYAGTLPVGRSRLVEVARALVDRPKVLLLDEPLSGLEEAEADRLEGIVRRVSATQSCAVVVVEHHTGFVMAACDEVVVLNLGSVLAHGTPAQVQGDAAVSAAYLG